MTSIHASIPPNMREAALIAKRRGDDPGSTISEDQDQRPSLRGKSASSSSVVMKKLPQRTTSTQSAPVPPRINRENESSGSEDSEDERSASKENDPMLSPSPVPIQSPRRPTLAKRPLSDLPTPVEQDDESNSATCLSPSEQNVVNNTFSPAIDRNLEATCKVPQLAESSQAVNFTGRGLQDVAVNGPANLILTEKAGDNYARPAKRVCSDEAKENVAEERLLEKLPERPAPSIICASKGPLSAARKASAPSSLGTGNMKGKAKIGLRRL